VRYGRPFVAICFIFIEAQVVTKDLWISNDLVQKRGVCENSLIYVLQLFLVPEFFQQILIGERQSEQILLATVVGRQLSRNKNAIYETSTERRTEYCSYL
jgi:hypothetical protein